MSILDYIFSNVKIEIVCVDNSYYLKISNEDYEYQFNCYPGNESDGKKDIGTSKPVKKLDIEGDKDKNKAIDGATSPVIFDNDAIYGSNKDTNSSEQPEENQTDSNNDLETPVISEEDSYLSDATLCSPISEIDSLESGKSESHSNPHKTTRISVPSLLKVSSNGSIQVPKGSVSASFSKIDVMATINEVSKATWRTLGCPHENQKISPLSYDNEKSLQFCHLCLQELLPV